MKRKLIKQGADSYTVTLPIKWIRDKGLNENSEIEIDEKEGRIIIDTEHSKKSPKSFLNIRYESTYDENLRHLLTHSYRKGVDVIKIENLSQKQLKIIEKETKELLLGFEVTEKELTSCIVESISEPTDDKFETILRRIFLLNKELIQQVSENILQVSNKNNYEIENLKISLDRYVIFIRRLIRKDNEMFSLDYWDLLRFLMHIGHSVYYLNLNLKFELIVLDSDLKKILIDLKDYYQLFYDSYYQKSLKKIHLLHIKKDEYQFGLIQNKLTYDSKNSLIYAHLYNIFREIQLGRSPVLSLVLEENSN